MRTWVGQKPNARHFQSQMEGRPELDAGKSAGVGRDFGRKRAGRCFSISAFIELNPAITVAPGLTDTFAGIRPRDVPGFLLA
jgi:hypothetical protein